MSSRRSRTFAGGLWALAGLALAAGPAYAHPPASPVEEEARLEPARETLDARIGLFASRVMARPEDGASWFVLGDYHRQRARIFGDLGDYREAERALRRATEILPEYLRAAVGLAGVLYDLHQFREALDRAEDILQRDPGSLDARVLRLDCLTALGRYEEARELLDALALDTGDQLAGAPALLVRRAQLAELHGHTGDAEALLLEARDRVYADDPSESTAAWYELRLAELEWGRGRLDTAERALHRALELRPGWSPALAAQARIEAARGRTGAALELYAQAVAAQPEPILWHAIGDLHAASGNMTEAEKAYGEAERLALASPLHRRLYRRQLALLWADLERNLDEAVRLAREDLAEREDIHAWDTLAWALYKRGEIAEAAAAVARATALGTEDARILYHAARIAQAEGTADRAQRLLRRARAVNPWTEPPPDGNVGSRFSRM
ncbi:MAG: tetratricopeptide repeat protein [Thermoanaerobaculia bacterium]